MKPIRMLVVLALAAAAGAFAFQNTPVAYPAGYREWHHVKSMVIESGHPLYEAFGGVHHVYANDRALDALRAAKTFTDGSVLVFDLLEARAEGHAVTEGPRKILGVMSKDSKRYSTTGGWGFEGFRGDTQERAVTDARTQCFECHETRQPADYVFSAYRN